MPATESYQTRSIYLEGGQRDNIEPVLRDNIGPGSLIDSQNMESGLKGGYARLKGYAKYDTAEVPGSGNILGCFVFNNGVLACRGTAIYHSTGSGWGSDIAPSARTSAGFYRATDYTWSAGKRICLVDGVNWPVRFVGTTGTDLSSTVQGATSVREFKNRLIFAKEGTITYTAADDDTDVTTGNGGGAIVIGDTITGLATARNALYIFCLHSIHRLTGSSASDFAVEPVTEDFGCVYPDTIEELLDDILFLGPDGIRTISATEKNVDVSLDTVSRPVQETILDNIQTFGEAGGRIVGISVDSKSQYRLFFAKSTVTAANSPGINACLDQGAQGNRSWEFFKTLGIQVVTADHGRLDDNSELIIHASYGGYVYKQEFGDNFDGSNISAFIQLPFLYFDDPAVRKVFYKLKLVGEVEGSAVAELTSQLLLDDEDTGIIQPSSIDMTTNIPTTIAIYGFTGGINGTRYGTSVYGQGANKNYQVGLVGGGFNGSFKISSNDSLPAYTLKTLIIEYMLGARQ